MSHNVQVTTTCFNTRSTSTIWEQSETDEPEYFTPPSPVGREYVGMDVGSAGGSICSDPLSRTVPVYANVAGTVASVAARTPTIGLQERVTKQEAEIDRLNRQINGWKTKIKEAEVVRNRHKKELFRLRSASNRHHLEICGVHCSW